MKITCRDERIGISYFSRKHEAKYRLVQAFFIVHIFLAFHYYDYRVEHFCKVYKLRKNCNVQCNNVLVIQVYAVVLVALGGCKMLLKLRLHLGVLEFYTLALLGLSNAQLENRKHYYNYFICPDYFLRKIIVISNGIIILY